MSPLIGSALYLLLFLLMLHFVDRLASRVPHGSGAGGDPDSGGPA